MADYQDTPHPPMGQPGSTAPPPPPPSPPPYSPPPPQYVPGAPQPRGVQGFWGRFFDFSFHEFITPSIIKVLFILAMVVIGLGVLAAIVMGFMAGAATGIVVLIGALIYGFITLLFSRVGLEVVIIFFRIHDDTREIAGSKRG